jgi:hypothetical protein
MLAVYDLDPELTYESLCVIPGEQMPTMLMIMCIDEDFDDQIRLTSDDDHGSVLLGARLIGQRFRNLALPQLSVRNVFTCAVHRNISLFYSLAALKLC